jgi:hypothetical protein
MRQTTPTTVYGQEAFAEELSIGVLEAPAVIADVEMEADSAAWVDDFDGAGRVFGLEEDTWLAEPERQYGQIAELVALAEEFGECVSRTESEDLINDEAETTEV